MSRRSQCITNVPAGEKVQSRRNEKLTVAPGGSPAPSPVGATNSKLAVFPISGGVGLDRMVSVWNLWLPNLLRPGRGQLTVGMVLVRLGPSLPFVQETVRVFVDYSLGEGDSCEVVCKTGAPHGVVRTGHLSACWICHPITQAAMHRENSASNPEPLVVAKHFGHVGLAPQAKPVLVRTGSENGGAERLCKRQGRPVHHDEIDVVAKQRHQADCKHERHKEQEENVEAAPAFQKARCAGISYPTHRPELNEVLERSGGHKQAVYQRVGQEQDEVLVVCERHTVVHPGAVMVHLQYA
ncbi:unnamed protein product, partial [Ixodes persulcatus]